MRAPGKARLTTTERVADVHERVRALFAEVTGRHVKQTAAAMAACAGAAQRLDMALDEVLAEVRELEESADRLADIDTELMREIDDLEVSK